MYSPIRMAISYLRYYLTASNGKGHGMHSPFVYDFIRNVLNDKRTYYAYEQVEELRKKLLRDDTLLSVNDMGAGSSLHNTHQRKIKDIAAHAAKPAKLGKLLFRMVNYYQPTHIVDIGTSLGITTCYLASGNTHASVFTLEGAAPVAAKAVANFKELGLTNVELQQGNFDDMLLPLMNKIPVADLVFFDGNHRKEPTLRYFDICLKKASDHSIFIFDDIHWSREMEQAWKEIQQHPAVTCTINLFFIGIVLFRKEFKEVQHFSIRF